MTNKFRMLLLSLAAVGLVGCSDKLIDDVGGLDQTQNKGEEGTVTFKISTVGSQTRAAEETTEGTTEGNPAFDKGDINEYAIANVPGANVLFLFDDKGIYYGKTDLQVLNTVTEGGTDNGHTKEGEMYFNARIRKEKDGNDWQCVIILNANPDELKSSNLNLKEGVTKLTEFYSTISNYDEKDNNLLGRFKPTDPEGKEGITYFTMSNTVYIKQTKSEVEGDNSKVKEPTCATSIENTKIKTTAQEAMADPVVVHVERLAAKFELKYADTTVKGMQSIINVTNKEGGNMLHVLENSNLTTSIQTRAWGVKILGWDVNAREKKTYFLKNLKYKNTPVYGETDGKIGDWSYEYDIANRGWNDPSRLRSYWAVDPHYQDNNDRYPQQYRPALNVSDNIESGITTEDALQYISYSKIKQFNKETEYTYHYAPENTFGIYENIMTPAGSNSEYTNDAYMRVGTHLLVAAKLVIADDANGDLEKAKEEDIYCYENIYWKGSYKDELVKYILNNVLLDYKTTLYVDDENGNKIELTKDMANEYFDLGEPATIEGGDGRVMLTLKSGSDDVKVYRYVAQEGGGTYEYEQVPTNDPALMEIIYRSGTAKHYMEGNMYYAIPIRHMVETKTVTDDNNSKTIYNYVGSYGVVRNHWYRVNITKIAKPGTPVDDPNDPIIPNDDPDDGGYIAFEIQIVPWHVIDQDITFE